MSDFLRGMGSINLLPKDRNIKLSPPSIKILSDAEAFKSDMEAVGNDMRASIRVINSHQKPLKSAEK